MVYYNILGVFDVTVVGGLNIRGKEAAGPDVIVEVGEGGALRVQSRAWELRSPRVPARKKRVLLVLKRPQIIGFGT